MHASWQPITAEDRLDIVFAIYRIVSKHTDHRDIRAFFVSAQAVANLEVHWAGEAIGPTGQLAAVSAANAVLDRDIGDISRRNGANRHAFAAAGGGTIWLPDDCAAAFSAQEQAYLVYNGHITYNRGNFFPLGWNQSSRSAAVGDAHHLGRTGSHNFWGYRDWWFVP